MMKKSNMKTLTETKKKSESKNNVPKFNLIAHRQKRSILLEEKKNGRSLETPKTGSTNRNRKKSVPSSSSVKRTPIVTRSYPVTRSNHVTQSCPVTRSKPVVTRSKPEVYVHAKEGRYLVHQMDPDGNCLFRTLAYHVLGNQNRHERVRDAIVDNICDNWDHYGGFTESEDEEAYRNFMGSLGEFGGQAEMIAFTDLYDCRVKVYFSSATEMEPLCFGGSGATCLLLYSGYIDAGHYDALKPIDKSDYKLYRSSIEKLRNITKRSI